MKRINKLLMSTTLLVAAGLASTSAFATDGMFPNGFGARQKALAGAGVADSRDATAGALNPAGLVHVDNQFAVSASLFSPWRDYTGGGPAGPFNFTPTGNIDSGSNYFAIPNMGASYRINTPLVDVVGLSVVGSGGMNTDWGNIARPGQCPSPPFPTTSGMFCAGPAGVDLQQMGISIDFAKQVAPGISVGVSPILAHSSLKVNGVSSFGGLSNDVNNLSNRGASEAWGVGVRGGVELAVMPDVRLGLSGTSPVYNQRFSKYSGLLANQGDMDIPGSIQAGVAYDAMPNITLMLDWKHIFYNSVESIGNPSTYSSLCAAEKAAGGATPHCLGGSDGIGFGWQDVDVVKLGAEWRDFAPGLTLRAGYSYNTNPVGTRDAMFNILAPAVIQHHITGGANVKLTDNIDFELSGMYAPYNTVKGFEIAPGNTAHPIEIGMYEAEATAGIIVHLGGTEAPLK
jgi:long-chain fatty acid transport protein